jgi:hypothetical protein
VLHDLLLTAGAVGLKIPTGNAVWAGVCER